MKLITAPNAWSCSAAALAMVLDIDYDMVIKGVGHDGSEIINPRFRSPGCRKGFHMQELIEVAIDHGCAVTPIEVLPVQTAMGDDEFDVEIKKYNTPEHRLRYHLDRSYGILMGKLETYWHSVAWNQEKIFDPRGRIYPFDDCQINIATYWRFDFIK